MKPLAPWLALSLLLATTACSSSSYEGVDMALELAITGASEDTLITMDGSERTLEFMMVGLTEMKLVACTEGPKSSSLWERFADVLVPSAHAHGVNTPISNGSTFELRLEKFASAFHEDERAFYPGVGMAICGLQLTFAPLDDDAEFLSTNSPLLNARVHAVIAGESVEAGGRDSVVIPLDYTIIRDDRDYTLRLDIEGSLNGLELSSTAMDSDTANELFDAFVELIRAEIVANQGNWDRN